MRHSSRFGVRTAKAFRGFSLICSSQRKYSLTVSYFDTESKTPKAIQVCFGLIKTCLGPSPQPSATRKLPQDILSSRTISAQSERSFFRLATCSSCVRGPKCSIRIKRHLDSPRISPVLGSKTVSSCKPADTARNSRLHPPVVKAKPALCNASCF